LKKQTPKIQKNLQECRRNDVEEQLTAIGFTTTPSKEIIKKAYCVTRAVDKSLDKCTENILRTEGIPDEYDK